MVTLKEDFTKEQEELADKLYDELVEHHHELEEFATIGIYGLRTEEDADGVVDNSILLSFDYEAPEGNNTIYFNY